MKNPFLLLALIAFADFAEAADTFSIRNLFQKLAEPPTYFQYQYGFASDSDFGVALLFYYDGAQEKTYTNALAAGWKLSDEIYGWPAEVALFAGVQVFDERGMQPDSYGVSIFPKIYQGFVFPFTDFPLRAGLGIGLSYVSRIPVAESRDFEPEESEKLVVYIDYSLQMSVARVLDRSATGLSSSLQDIFIGYSIIHRSTAYGVFAETGGGINYLGLGVEFVFR